MAFDFVAAHPLGGGLGFNEARLGDLIAMRDSVIVATVIQFGLVGALVYGASIWLLFGRLWTYYRRRPAPRRWASPARASASSPAWRSGPSPRGRRA